MQAAVCPPNLKAGLFSTSAIDNIDNNPSSTSVHASFNRTEISIFQHPEDSKTGVKQSVDANPDDIPRNPKTKLAHFPTTYTNVPPAAKLRQAFPVLKFEGHNIADCQLKLYRMSTGTSYCISLFAGGLNI